MINNSSQIRPIKLNLTTDSAGAATAVSEDNDIFGFLYAVQLVDGDFADGVDVTLTAEEGDLSIPLYTKADWNTDQMVYPRAAPVLNTDGSALTVSHAMSIVVGQVKAVIAQGGDVKTGAIVVYIV